MKKLNTIKLFCIMFGLLTVTVPTTQAQSISGTDISLNGNNAYISGMSNIRPSVFNIGFTNAFLAPFGIPVGQLAGYYADGTQIADARDLLPFVGQSLEVVDAAGDTVVSITEMGLNMWDPATSSFVPVSISNGMMVVGGNMVSGGAGGSDDQNLGLTGTLITIEDGTGVDLDATFATDAAVDAGLMVVSNTLADTITTLETTIQAGGVTNTAVQLTDGDGSGTDTMTTTNGVLYVNGVAVDTDTQLTDADISALGFIKTDTDTDEQGLSLAGSTLNIDRGTGVDLGNTFATDTELTTISNDLAAAIAGAGGSGDMHSDGSVAMAADLNMGGNCVTNTPCIWLTDPSTGDSIMLQFTNGQLVVGGTVVSTPSAKAQQAPLILASFDFAEAGSTNILDLISGGSGTGAYEYSVLSNATLAGTTLSWDTNQLAFAIEARRFGDNDYYATPWYSQIYSFILFSAESKLTASDAAAGDEFGFSVAISGDTLVVGAYQDDDGGTSSGSAYVFTRSGNTWTQQAKLTAPDAAASDYFGKSVAISGDSVVVGAYGNDDAGSTSGSAYVFTRSGTTWTEQQKVTASDAAAGDRFGESVAISGDTLLVGAHANDDAGSNSGSAYVFTRIGNTWTEQQKLAGSDTGYDDNFGKSVAISGDTLVVGAYIDDDDGSASGSAYVFTRSSTTWTQKKKLTASDAAAGDYFGESVAISGDTLVVGADRNDDAGGSSGSAYVFTRSGTSWTEQQKLTASDAAAGDYFGESVAISGDRVVVGAYQDDDGGTSSGSAYVFTRSGNTWTQQAKLTAPDAAASDYFGKSVAISGDSVVVGAYGNDDAGSTSGSAYVFTRSGTTWTEQQKLTASDAAADDFFGRSVAISGDSVVVGAYKDDDSGATDSGSVYVYDDQN